MKVRIKTLEELKSRGADISIDTIGGMGRYVMNRSMIKYLGREIDLYHDPIRDETYYNESSTGLCLWTWESWMFEEIKEMNRNGANEGIFEGANE